MVLKSPLTISIVIPTYNRRTVVTRSIDSALCWSGDTGEVQIVLVDDKSTDGTMEFLAQKYRDEIDSLRIALCSTPVNCGAAGAKNFGAGVANGQWLLFLDSDDLLIEDTKPAVVEALRAAAAEHSVAFFRCNRLATGQLLGDPLEQPIAVDPKVYFRDWCWGECLPIVKADVFRDFPYDASLRGHEGLAYARMFKHHAPGILRPEIVRLYDDSGDDRLSTRAALLERSHLLAKGYAITLREFWRDLGIRRSLVLMFKCAAYIAASRLYSKRR